MTDPEAELLAPLPLSFGGFAAADGARRHSNSDQGDRPGSADQQHRSRSNSNSLNFAPDQTVVVVSVAEPGAARTLSGGAVAAATQSAVFLQPPAAGAASHSSDSDDLEAPRSPASEGSSGSGGGSRGTGSDADVDDRGVGESKRICSGTHLTSGAHDPITMHKCVRALQPDPGVPISSCLASCFSVRFCQRCRRALDLKVTEPRCLLVPGTLDRLAAARMLLTNFRVPS
jgi:hypothetical protein